MNPGTDSPGENDLLVEQIDFYRTDAETFDVWLKGLLDVNNDDSVALTYREGRTRIARIFEQYAPLGRILEIAAGTGRLVELYAPHADSMVLVDASPESLAIAARRLATSERVRCVEADFFKWEAKDEDFDTIIFSAWLHHVPRTLMDTFWVKVESLLTKGGRVIFDFPDANIGPPGTAEVPAEAADGYVFYAPGDGISIRDHSGRRFRVVHHLWDPNDLRALLARIGWTFEILGPGLFGNVLWAEAHRMSR